MKITKLTPFCVCLLIVMSFLITPAVHAEDGGNITPHFSSEFSSVAQGSDFCVKFSLAPEFSGLIAAFTVQMYLPDDISFVGMNNFCEFSSEEVQYHRSADKITILYLTEYDGFTVESGKSQDILALNFRSGENCLGDYSLNFSVSGIVTGGLEYAPVLNPSVCVPVSVRPYEQTDCRLKSLSPDVGSLVPDFNPDINVYSLDVDENVREVLFSAEAIDPSVIVSVGRKALYKAGTVTPITITIKAASGDSFEYLVNVKRGELDDDAKAALSKSASSRASASKSASSRSPSAGTSSNGVSTSDEDGSALNPVRRALDTRDNSFWIYLAVLVALTAFGCGFMLWRNKRMTRHSDKDSPPLSDDSDTQE